MGRVRAFVQDDIPSVAELCWQFLQNQKGPHPPSLERYFHEVFFHNPWLDSSIESLVYEEGQHEIVGFLGVVPRPMSLNGKPIQAAFTSSMVVHPDRRSTMAGLTLLKAFFGGKQDLAMTDTGNRLTQRIWVALGGSASSAYGFQWARPLRPSLYALYVMSRFGKDGLARVAGRACRFLGNSLGGAVTRIPLGLIRRPPCGITEVELEINTLLHACLPGSAECYSVRPEYNRASLGWLLGFMSRMRAYGNLRKVALRDATGQLIGWLIYYTKRSGIAEVVQMGALRSHLKTVHDYLVWDARNRGAIALHGRLEIRHAQELSENRSFFWATVPLLFRARNPELARIVQQGDAFLSRLDGEWCLKYGATGLERASVVPNSASEEESSHEQTMRLAPGNFPHAATSTEDHQIECKQS